jgi:TP901 family phage tail tape measure protein
VPTISTLVVDVQARTAPFASGMQTVAGLVVGVGAIATKMALDYDDAFTKIAATSNASAKDIERWREQVLTLAGATAQAPKELADALFFLASAGLKANQIMPTLEASAKASAAGLGETEDVAKLTAQTLNAYAGTGLQAANVTDILTAAVREGSADTDEFGTAIGRILPIASTAGLSFDQVAASLSTLSSIGLDVNEGVTAMRGLLQALVAPGSAAAESLKSIGLSAQDLLTSLQEEGLIGTLRMLEDRVHKSTDGQAEFLGVMRTIVPNVRALTGELGLTVQQQEKVDAIFRRVTHSVGDGNKAFNETAESAGFKLRKALVELQVVLTRLGGQILPIVTDVVVGLEKEFRAWAAMIENVSGVMSRFAERVGAGIRTIRDDFHTFVENIKGIFMGLPDWFANIGRSIMSGLWNGLKSMFSTIWNSVTDFVGSVVDKVKSAIGFGSPSKVFEEIGMSMMAGMDQGIRRGMRGVNGTLAGIRPAINGVGGGAGVSGDVVLQVDGRTFARITRDQLLKLGNRNAGTGL